MQTLNGVCDMQGSQTKCSVATCGQWLMNWMVQMETLTSFYVNIKYLLHFSVVEFSSNVLPCKKRPEGIWVLGFFWPCCMACGISVPQPGIQSGTQQWESRILTTGSPGNSWGLSLLFSLNFTMSCSPIWKVMSSVSTAHLNQLRLLLIVVVFMVIFPGGSAGKESCLQCRRPWFDSWIGKIHWRRERLPTPAFWPGELHGLYSPWGGKESDTTERFPLSWSSYLCVQALRTSVFCRVVSQFICV